jgi:hypothetical protein
MAATRPFTREEKLNSLFALPALLGVALAVIYVSTLGFFSFVISGLFVACLQYGLLFLVALVGVSILLSGYGKR